MQTFSKYERLCSKKVIGDLFDKGNNLIAYPITLKWIENPLEDISISPAKVLFVVSKRNFKLAVKRNTIKRLLRECYRHNKPFLYNFLIQNNISISFSVAYIGKSEPNYSLIKEKFVEILNLLIEQFANKEIKENGTT